MVMMKQDDTGQREKRAKEAPKMKEVVFGEIEFIKKCDLKRGNIVFLKSAVILSNEHRHMLTAQLDALLPDGVRGIILDSNMELGVLNFEKEITVDNSEEHY